MIKSKEDYKYYLEADRLNMKCFDRKRPKFLQDEEWRYLRLLRKVEYITNCKKGPFWKFVRKFQQLRLRRLGLKTGFTIPANVFKEGLTLFHYGTIVVNSNARVGRDCHLYTCTNIANGVTIGDKVFIAPGVKINNDVTIADGIKIGANSVVTRSFLEPYITIAGAPARKIADGGTGENYSGGIDRLKQLQQREKIS